MIIPGYIWAFASSFNDDFMFEFWRVRFISVFFCCRHSRQEFNIKSIISQKNIPAAFMSRNWHWMIAHLFVLILMERICCLGFSSLDYMASIRQESYRVMQFIYLSKMHVGRVCMQMEFLLMEKWRSQKMCWAEDHTVARFEVKVDVLNPFRMCSIHRKWLSTTKIIGVSEDNGMTSAFLTHIFRYRETKARL